MKSLKQGETRTKVLYIIGSGRSGSTIVASILGKDKSIINAGEIYNFKWFFDSADKFERKCSCKQLLNKCNYWQSVRQQVESNIDDDLPDLKKRDLKAFSVNNAGIFSAICTVSGKNIVIDSSKRVYRLTLLNKTPDVEVIVLHLIRDVRAYAHSSRITEIKKGASNFVYFKKVFEWEIKNLFVFITQFFCRNYVFMRYEDFVENPNLSMLKIYEKLNIHGSSVEDLDKLDVEQSHQFSGNSGVFDQGSIVLKKDVRYLTQVKSWEWILATLIALPAIILFRYPITRRAVKK